MARHKRGSRSRAIRNYLAENPAAGPKDVVNALKIRGITVTTDHVSGIKYRKRQAAPAGPPPRRGRPPRVAASGPTNGLTVDQLLEVKMLAGSLGGVDQVRRALDALEQLQ